VPAVPRYVERVAALLRQRLLQSELLLAKRDALAQRRRRAAAEQAELEPKLQRLQDTVHELQRLVRPENPRTPVPGLQPPRCCRAPPGIEADISKRYGGRPVNLMGINV
ncbi:CK5P3 protein, partial [Thryothorus ludovicianus]|nr:CK5P3 protein [Thryothorus ludovicianus]